MRYREEGVLSKESASMWLGQCFGATLHGMAGLIASNGEADKENPSFLGILLEEAPSQVVENWSWDCSSMFYK